MLTMIAYESQISYLLTNPLNYSTIYPNASYLPRFRSIHHFFITPRVPCPVLFQVDIGDPSRPRGEIFFERKIYKVILGT